MADPKPSRLVRLPQPWLHYSSSELGVAHPSSASSALGTPCAIAATDGVVRIFSGPDGASLPVARRTTATPFGAATTG